jgi:hypothetical protein
MEYNKVKTSAVAGKGGWIEQGGQMVKFEDRRNYGWLVWLLFFAFLGVLWYVVTHSEQIHQFLYA